MNNKRKTFFFAETLSRRDGENPKPEAPIHKQFGISNFQIFETLFAIVSFNI